MVIQQPWLWIIVLWSTEIWLLQGHTLGFDYTAPLARRASSAGWRAMLDISGVAAFVCLMPRLVITLAALWWVFAVQSLVMYHDVFHRALSWSTLSVQFTEGTQGAGFDSSYVLNPIFISVTIALLVKLVWLWRMERPAWSVRSRLGGAFLVAYLAQAVVGIVVLDPLSKLRRFGTAERMGATHGYMLTWLGEAIFLNQRLLLNEALERAKITDRSLIEQYGPMPLSDATTVVLLQVESLDWRALGHEVNGQPIVPFFRARMTDSVVFNVETVHDNGSADADFMWLTGHLPSERIITYKLRNYPYEDGLAHKAKAAQFESTFVHGNSGVFFDRRIAVDQMPFDEILFLEEWLSQGYQPTLWGIDDDVVFDALGSKIDHNKKQLMYVVTLTSHQPFDYVVREKQELIIEPQDLEERYFTSIYYTDQSIAAFYDALPAGAVVIAYGDHRSIAVYEPSNADFAIEGEHVPMFVHMKGKDLASAIGIEFGTTSSMHAVVTWFYDWLER